jgi:hypothetical protein
MAQRYTGTFGTLIKPSSVVDVKVQQSNSGVATTGVLMLVGEAEAGPDVQSDNIVNNYFGPDELTSVLAKYKSGPLVEAFKMACQASNDPGITGSFTRAYLAKTNVSTKASGSLTRSGLANWATVADKSYGSLGNLTNLTVTSGQDEVAPTTGSFTYIPYGGVGASSIGIRVNGGSLKTLSPAALTSPTALVTAINALGDLLATGGVDRGVLNAGNVTTGNLALTGSSGSIVIGLDSGTWAVTPTPGDTLILSATSVLADTETNNRGSYVVTAATSTSISATKLADATTTGGAVNVTTPVGSVDIAAVGDILCYSPVSVTNLTGTSRAVLTGLVGQNVTGTAASSSLTLTLATGQVWAATPAVGDYLQIASTAPGGWTPGTNAGWYRVTASGSSTIAGGSYITMTKLSNGDPVSFGATAVAATSDLVCLRPAIDGIGKSLEFCSLSGVTAESQFFNLSTTAVTWVSTLATPYLLTSATEREALLTASRSVDNITESFQGDGDVVLRVGYHGGTSVSGITGTMTISGTTLTTTVSGGTGGNLSLNLKNFKTLNDLATYINAQTGYKASVASALFGQAALNYTDANNTAQVILDKGTFGIASHLQSVPGRVKKEAFALWKLLADSAILVQLGSTVSTAPTAGQPENQGLFFLANGARGGSSTSDVTSAIDQLEKVRGNFLVTLFSRDAASDIADGSTDASSLYAIDSINAYAKSHVLAMSQIKRRRHRQAFVSKKGTFTEAKLASSNLASSRVAMCFQDFKLVALDGSLTQFQPWAGSVLVAAMQAAGFYKPVVNKFINCSGVLMGDGSYSDQVLSQVEDALLSGLLPAEQADTGGFKWVSDQTTYGVDDNFVYNSVQAMYVADVIALTLASRMERAFVGQSLGDVGSGVMLAYLQGVLSDLKRLKLIASSDGAPAGYRNASVRITGPVAEISVEIFEATGLYFIPITALINQVQQSSAV